jgi:hypothetical protein
MTVTVHTDLIVTRKSDRSSWIVTSVLPPVSS